MTDQRPLGVSVQCDDQPPRRQRHEPERLTDDVPRRDAAGQSLLPYQAHASWDAVWLRKLVCRPPLGAFELPRTADLDPFAAISGSHSASWRAPAVAHRTGRRGAAFSGPRHGAEPFSRGYRTLSEERRTGGARPAGGCAAGRRTEGAAVFRWPAIGWRSGPAPARVGAVCARSRGDRKHGYAARRERVRGCSIPIIADTRPLSGLDLPLVVD